MQYLALTKHKLGCKSFGWLSIISLFKILGKAIAVFFLKCVKRIFLNSNYYSQAFKSANQIETSASRFSLSLVHPVAWTNLCFIRIIIFSSCSISLETTSITLKSCELVILLFSPSSSTPLSGRNLDLISNHEEKR